MIRSSLMVAYASGLPSNSWLSETRRLLRDSRQYLQGQQQQNTK